MSEINGPRILYVEDEPMILELGATALEEAGFAVEALSSGESAIAAIDEPGGDFKALITTLIWV
jgi:DNA-binding response OmpR family regulator